jgi:hypothetical protein
MTMENLKYLLNGLTTGIGGTAIALLFCFLS